MQNLYNAIYEFVSSGLFFDEILHGIFAAPLGYWIWIRTHNKKNLIIFYLVVYAIDIDHLVDDWAYWGFNLNPYKFVKFDYFKYSDVAYVPFHAWEWVIVLYLLGFLKTKLKKFWCSKYVIFATAILAHMAWDTLRVENFAFYSIIYRAMNGFGKP